MHSLLNSDSMEIPLYTKLVECVNSSYAPANSQYAF